MKESKSKIIIILIVFVLGVGVGIFSDKKILSTKCNIENNSTSQVLDELKTISENQSVEDKKNALKDAYIEIENLVQKELDLQTEIMRLENEINNETDLNEDENIDDDPKHIEQENDSNITEEN